MSPNQSDFQRKDSVAFIKVIFLVQFVRYSINMNILLGIVTALSMMMK